MQMEEMTFPIFLAIVGTHTHSRKQSAQFRVEARRVQGWILRENVDYARKEKGWLGLMQEDVGSDNKTSCSASPFTTMWPW